MLKIRMAMKQIIEGIIVFIICIVPKYEEELDDDDLD